MQGLDKNSSLYDRVCIFKSLCWYLAGENLIDTRAPWRTPFAAWFDHRSVAGWVDRQRLPQWVREMWRLACLDILSIEPEKISLLYWIWYQPTNGGFFQIANDRTGGPQEFSVDIGLGGLLERYATEFTGTTRLSTPVHTIDHSAPDTVVLTTTDGERIEARRAVVAVTPHAAGRHLRFSPPLSSARQQFHAQPIGHAAKAVIVYPTPWWRSCHGYHYFSLSAGAFAEGVEWALDTSHPDGRQYSLTVFVGERLFARSGPQASAGSIHRAITQELAEAFDDARALAYTHLELQPLAGSSLRGRRAEHTPATWHVEPARGGVQLPGGAALLRKLRAVHRLHRLRGGRHRCRTAGRCSARGRRLARRRTPAKRPDARAFTRSSGPPLPACPGVPVGLGALGAARRADPPDPTSLIRRR